MRTPALFGLMVLFAACNTAPTTGNHAVDSQQVKTTRVIVEKSVDTVNLLQPNVPVEQRETKVDSVQQPSSYANKRFKDVTAVRSSEHAYTIKGKGQIFEGQFNWELKDGTKAIKSGTAMTDGGPPAWGNFKFTVDVPASHANTLTLVLYEISAKDGSRQHELFIPLQ